MILLFITFYIVTIHIGALPNAICSLDNLYTVQTNINLFTCAPSCLSSVTVLSVPTNICPPNQDGALCGFIASTNIYSLSGYSQWNCTAFGFTTTNPCSLPVWPGIGCSVDNNVISIGLNSVGLIGTQ